MTVVTSTPTFTLAAALRNKHNGNSQTQVLPFTLTLWDVDDVEASIAQRLHENLRANNVPTHGQDYLDLVKYLIDVAVDEAAKYNPGYGLKFRTILNYRVSQRTVDWLRKNKRYTRRGVQRGETVPVTELDTHTTTGFEDQIISEMSVTW